MSKTKILKVMIISDGTGETAYSVAKAAMSQFREREIQFTRYKNVRSIEKIEILLTEAIRHFDIILYTLAQKTLRDKVSHLSTQNNIQSIDILGPVLSSFSTGFDIEKEFKPGLLHDIDEDYFKKVSAIEYTISHDQSTSLEEIRNKLILFYSKFLRTSKTPLSVYLSLKGLKVLNYPIQMNQDVPAEILSTDQSKIYGLTVQEVVLEKVRKRIQAIKEVSPKQSDYADTFTLQKEIEWGNCIFEKNPKWPVFDVSDKSLEETAAGILKIYYMRSQNMHKQSQRLK